MKNIVKNLLLISLLTLSAVFYSGCAIGALGAVGAPSGGTVIYVRGDLEATYDNSLEQVHDAAYLAIQDLGFALISDRGDRTGGDIIARTGSDRRIRIAIRPVGDNLTQAKIRIGTFGDQDLSMRIHESIRQRL